MANDMADAVARLTGECRGQERLNNPDCEVATADLRALLAAYADAARDRERMDWLEAREEFEVRVTHADAVTEIAWRDGLRPRFARAADCVSLRAAIDAARTGEAR